jgi:hypothetical protein
MAFGPNLFTGQLTTQNQTAQLPPPQLVGGGEFTLGARDTIADEIASLADNSTPSKGIQLNQFQLSPEATFVARSGEQVMPNKNPESFIRQGGLVVDGPHIYIDSFEQSQIPSANLRGALIRMVQSGVGSVGVRSFTKDRVIGSKELISRRFRLL